MAASGAAPSIGRFAASTPRVAKAASKKAAIACFVLRSKGAAKSLRQAPKYESTSGRWGREAGARYRCSWARASSWRCDLENGRNTRFAKILTFEQERLTGDFGEGVGKAIAEVQPGWVASLAEIRPGLAGGMRLFLCNRLDTDARRPEK